MGRPSSWGSRHFTRLRCCPHDLNELGYYDTNIERLLCGASAGSTQSLPASRVVDKRPEGFRESTRVIDRGEQSSLSISDGCGGAA